MMVMEALKTVTSSRRTSIPIFSVGTTKRTSRKAWRIVARKSIKIS